mgnify:CR=1 FL=1|tara:strand:- start:7775 stop:8620 length:846 start_codon:yes stop_codon:yes gene_type:complete
MPTKILNSVNNALRGVTNPVNRLVGGTLAQPGLSLFGTNLPGAPLISFRDTFLKSLSQWNTSIPLNTQFIILIDNFPVGLTTQVLRELEPVVNSTGFDINLAKETTTNFKNQGMVGCIFANQFNIPDDSVVADKATIQNNRGFIPGSVLKNRNNFGNFSLSLRETNTSFVDFVMRPWVIMASHYGLVARNPNDQSEVLKNPKTNLTVVQYTRSKEGLSQIPRKTWRFYNCVPTSISSRDYKNDESEGVKNFTTTWTFDKYEISSNLYLSVSEMLKAINPLY